MCPATLGFEWFDTSVATNSIGVPASSSTFLFDFSIMQTLVWCSVVDSLVAAYSSQFDFLQIAVQ